MNLRSIVRVEETAEFNAVADKITTLREESFGLRDYSNPVKDIIKPIAYLHVLRNNILPTLEETLLLFNAEKDKLDEECQVAYLIKATPLLNLSVCIDVLSKFDSKYKKIINLLSDDDLKKIQNKLITEFDLGENVLNELAESVVKNTKACKDILHQAAFAPLKQARFDVIKEKRAEKDNSKEANKNDSKSSPSTHNHGMFSKKHKKKNKDNETSEKQFIQKHH